jgi:hypothetical protein
VRAFVMCLLLRQAVFVRDETHDQGNKRTRSKNAPIALINGLLIKYILSLNITYCMVIADQSTNLNACTPTGGA